MQIGSVLYRIHIHTAPWWWGRRRVFLLHEYTAPVGVIVIFVSVVLPLERLKVVQTIRATVGNRLYVVYLPAMPFLLSIFVSLDDRTANIDPDVMKAKDRCSPSARLPQG